MAMRFAHWTAFLLVACWSAPAPAKSACPEAAKSKDGGIVYIKKGNDLVPLQSADIESEQRRTYRLYYVVKSPFDRSGAVVIKSARFGIPRDDDVPNVARVKLMRAATAKDLCDRRNTYLGSVSLGAYQEYHDLGQDGGTYLSATENGRSAVSALKNFHFKYEKGGRCIDTDSREGPQGLFGLNNRSQFSFETTIVNTGHSRPYQNVARRYSGYVVSAFLPVARAAEQTVLEHNVQLRAYRTENRYACVVFDITVRAPRQILRVNDLEARFGGTQYFEFRVGPP